MTVMLIHLAVLLVVALLGCAQCSLLSPLYDCQSITGTASKEGPGWQLSGKGNANEIPVPKVGAGDDLSAKIGG